MANNTVIYHSDTSGELSFDRTHTRIDSVTNYEITLALEHERERCRSLETRLRKKDEVQSELTALQKELYENLAHLTARNEAFEIENQQLKLRIETGPTQQSLNQLSEKISAKTSLIQQQADIITKLKSKITKLRQQPPSYTHELADIKENIQNLQSTFRTFKTTQWTTPEHNKIIDRIQELMRDTSPPDTFPQTITASTVEIWLRNLVDEYMVMRKNDSGNSEAVLLLKRIVGCTDNPSLIEWAFRQSRRPNVSPRVNK